MKKIKDITSISIDLERQKQKLYLYSFYGVFKTSQFL